MSANWVKVCKTDHLPLYTGISVLVFGRQVAIFRLKNEYYAISDYDPFSGSYVLSRGFVDDEGEVPKVSSPVYSQSFSLVTGECLNDPAIKLATYPIQIVDGAVYIAIQAERESRYTFQTVSSKR
jgi:nitrite reductase (NADH) small subunit